MTSKIRRALRLSPVTSSQAATIVVAVLILSIAVSTSHQQDQLPLKSDPLIIELHHKIGDHAEFKPRGSILVRPKTEYRAAQASILSQAELSDADWNLLKETSESDGSYYLRAVARKKGDKSSEPIKTTQTLVRACALVTSDLVDFLTVNLNSVNDFISVNLYTTNPDCIDSSATGQSSRRFNTTVSVDSGSLGPTPDTGTYIKRLEEERQSKLKEGEKDNRSFFVKYWYYIVPAVVILMMMGGPEQGSR